MDNKVKKMIIRLFLFSLIATIFIALVVKLIQNSRDKKRQEELEIQESIFNQFEEFKEDMIEINERVHSFTDTLEDIVQFDIEIHRRKDTLQSIFVDFEEELNAITKQYPILSKYCPGNQYGNAMLQYNCDRYSLSIETLINGYIQNVENTNNKITMYNNKINNKETNYHIVDLIQSTYFKEFVDYNENNEMEGI